jgi:stage II sporulation protein AA (anti-sigma F factor antagonist)
MSDDVYAAFSFALPRPGLALVRITGELDACSAQQIEERMRQSLAPGYPQVIVDLQDLDFIDSTGIRLLVQVVTQKQDPLGVVVVCPRALVARRALELVGLTRIMRTVESIEDALGSSNPSIGGGAEEFASNPRTGALA